MSHKGASKHGGGHGKLRSKRFNPSTPIRPPQVNLRVIAGNLNGLMQNSMHLGEQYTPEGHLIFSPREEQMSLGNEHGTMISIVTTDKNGNDIEFTQSSRASHVDRTHPKIVNARVTIHHNGLPVRGIIFTVDVDGKEAVSKKTDENGRFTIDNLSPEQTIHLHCPIPKRRKLLLKSQVYPSSNGNGRSI